jgi:glutaryl-CoA transferase
MSVTGERDGEPTKAGVALLDVVTGLYATVGILAALHERGQTGRGRHVTVSLFDASVAAMVNQASNFLVGGLVPRAMGTQHPNIVPYQAFRASDRPFIVAGGNDRIFRRICGVVGHPAWAEEPAFSTNEARVANRDELVARLADVFARRDAATWLGALESASVPCAPIRSMDEVFASPEGEAVVESVHDAVRGNDLRLVRDPLRFDGEPTPTRLPPPILGQHTEEILEQLP